MRMEFRADLEKYGELAKKQMKPEISNEDDFRVLQEVFDFINGTEIETTGEGTIKRKIVGTAERYGTGFGVQLDIFALQRKKQEVMAWLKNELKKLDETKPKKQKFAPNSRHVTYRNGVFYWTSQGQEIPITPGEMITDLNWGVYYQLDQKTVPRLIKKEYLIETARHRLKQYLDEQILRNEGSKNLKHE